MDFRLARPQLPLLTIEMAHRTREGALWARAWDTFCSVCVLPLYGGAEEAEPWDNFCSVPLLPPEGGVSDEPLEDHGSESDEESAATKYGSCAPARLRSLLPWAKPPEGVPQPQNCPPSQTSYWTGASAAPPPCLWYHQAGRCALHCVFSGSSVNFLAVSAWISACDPKKPLPVPDNNNLLCTTVPVRCVLLIYLEV